MCQSLMFVSDELFQKHHGTWIKKRVFKLVQTRNFLHLFQSSYKNERMNTILLLNAPTF